MLINYNIIRHTADASPAAVVGVAVEEADERNPLIPGLHQGLIAVRVKESIQNHLFWSELCSAD